MSRSDYNTLNNAYISNIGVSGRREGFAMTNLDYVKNNLEALSENVRDYKGTDKNSWESSLQYKIHKQAGSKDHRKLCGPNASGQLGSAGANANLTCYEGPEYLPEVDGVQYYAYINTDQNKQTLAKLNTKNISGCFDAMRYYKKQGKDANGIVYYPKQVGNDKKGTCFVIKRKVPEGSSTLDKSYDSYRNEGAVLVIDSQHIKNADWFQILLIISFFASMSHRSLYSSLECPFTH